MDAAQQPAPRSSGNRGRGMQACRNCARAKTKCFPHPEGITADCERCYRLKKECIKREPTVRKRRNDRATRVARLEEKLDGLASLLASSRSMGIGPQANLVTPVSNSSTPHDSYNDSSNGQENPQHSHVTDTYTSPVICDGDTSNNPVARSSGSEPNDVEDPSIAESLFTTFRTQMGNYFPFVVLPPNVSSQDIRRERPILYKAILMAASHLQFERQAKIVKELTQELNHCIFVEGKKNMDILQGMLVYIAWYHYHFPIQPLVTFWIQLAMGIVAELGLHKWPQMMLRHRNFAEVITTEPWMNERTMDDRRAVLGCFYLSSKVSSSFKKLEAMKWTPYLDDCCRVIEASREYESDVILVTLIRLQEIVSRLMLSLPYDDPDFPQKGSVPLAVVTKSFQTELNMFKESVPRNLRDSYFFMMHWHAANICLYELSIHGWVGYGRIDALYACLQAAKQVTSLFLNIPVREVFTLPYITCADLSYALLACSSLSQFNGEGWDGKAMQLSGELNFISILESVTNRFDEAREESKALTGREGLVFARATQKLQRVIALQKAKAESSDSEPPNSQEPNVQDIQIPDVGTLQPFVEGELGFTDELFWQDVVADFGFL
ncbi:hypothetical protein BDY21DRAFT_341047 [Lineolata rhizophorae]|uniref:Zn(2)-C6 fungal-type domain-containing protein n=1 Tax=Lineolata rhizophorae TaxID=578093 RepID=A0A6A6P3W4_9PEZI|nr:hypothetical protein BDY21DRAFT_341047 [Lineolata rhizophorae]